MTEAENDNHHQRLRDYRLTRYTFFFSFFLLRLTRSGFVYDWRRDVIDVGEERSVRAEQGRRFLRG